MTGPVPSPAQPPAVAATIDALPAALQPRFRELRDLIFAVAARDARAGPLTETLKWGEPAHLTGATGRGSTIRLGRTRGSRDRCRTALVEGVRAQFRGLAFEGDRAVLVDPSAPIRAAAHCIARALGYHRDKRRARA